MTKGWLRTCMIAMACCIPGVSAVADTTYPLNNDPTVKQALERFYNLDYDGAQSKLETVLKEHPQDPMAMGYVLTVVIFRELYNEDLLDTTYYAHENFLSSGRKVEIPHEVRQRIEDLTNGAVAVCDQRIKQNEDDKDAYFARSYVRGMHAAFLTLADHSFAGAAHQGLSSRNDAEEALKLDPNYTDAKMAIGIQQFAAGSLPRWVRMMVGIFGMGGNKERGLALLRECAAHGTLTRVESMTALMLFLRHDGRYDDAVRVAEQLSSMYPHDYLYRLELANLSKDGGHGPQAIGLYKNVLSDAARHGYFIDARLQLAYFGLAETERGQGQVEEALDDYLSAAKQPKCSEWMRKRAQLNAGMMYDLLHRHQDAVAQYELAAGPGVDQSQADAAHRYIKSAYTGK